MMNQNSAFEERSIPLKQLNLWDENPRFPSRYFGRSPKELMGYLYDHYDILGLVEGIVNDFDLPQLELLVVYETDDRFLVIEGNRRLVAYTLLANPELAPDESSKEKFRELQKKVGLKDNFLLKCFVTKSLTQAKRYAERKHLRGNNEVGWGDQERANYRVREGIAKETDILKVRIEDNIIAELDIPEKMKDDVLGPGCVTTFWRILLGSPAKEFFGLRLSTEEKLQVDDPNFTKKLKVIIVNVLNKEDFNGKRVGSRSWNTVSEKKEYLHSITEEDYKRAEEAIEKFKKSIQEDELPKRKEEGKKRSRSSFTEERKFLIPSELPLKIDNPKINRMFNELKRKLPLKGNKAVPNAVGALFRVFLEISLDYFLKEKLGEEAPTQERGIANKIKRVADYLESKGIEKAQLKNIRMVAKNEESMLCIENFHLYIHSDTTIPEPRDLKLKWDNLQPFFEILWLSLSNKA